MASLSNWKLRRLAGRGVRVVNRRKTTAPAIGAYERTFMPLALAFIAAYDLAVGYANTWRKEFAEGRNAVGVLLKKIQAWVPLVARDVPGVVAAEFGDQPGVPDDVIGDGERLLDLIDDHRRPDGTPLPYRESGMADLGAAFDAAVKEWSEAEASDSQYQQSLKTVRETGNAFDAELQAFRRTLANTVGRRDKDFQKLRASKAKDRDDDDDPAAPPASSLLPAPPSALPPK